MLQKPLQKNLIIINDEIVSDIETSKFSINNSYELLKLVAIVTCGVIGAITFPILIGFVF